jgi:hypothetical protein
MRTLDLTLRRSEHRAEHPAALSVRQLVHGIAEQATQLLPGWPAFDVHDVPHGSRRHAVVLLHQRKHLVALDGLPPLLSDRGLRVVHVALRARVEMAEDRDAPRPRAPAVIPEDARRPCRGWVSGGNHAPMIARATDASSAHGTIPGAATLGPV